MASRVPDATSLQSWEDAFQHPLPVVRKLEQQLRKNIDDNRQKLRSLVGASYRDLLGTAERIIEMDDQMQTVESSLGDIGRKCNARTVERIGQNHERMRQTKQARDGDRDTAIAQTKVLQNVLTVLSRIIKSGGDALQASKLLVLARLLYKSISEGSDAPPVVDDLKRKLVVLRKKLLNYVERTMVRPSVDRALLAHALSAYALVTTSTPKEVLLHFLQVRYSQLEATSEASRESGVLQVLDLFGQTLLDTRDLFPRRFAGALSQLATTPLLQDAQIQSISELGLDVYGSWISDNVQRFIPWVRHDELTTAEVSDALQSWCAHAHGCLIRGVRASLDFEESPQAIRDSRHKVLSRYMSLGRKVQGNTHTEAIQDLRGAFLGRLEEVIRQTVNLSGLVLEEWDVYEQAKLAPPPQNLWDLAVEDLDLSHGARNFRQSIVQSRNGRSVPLQAAIEKLDGWSQRINQCLDVVDEMRTTRWDDDLDSDLDEFGADDTLMQALRREDPDRLQERLRQATQSTITGVLETITSAANSTKNAAFYLRLWREVEYRRSALLNRLNMPIGKVLLAGLQQNVARLISRPAVDEYVRSSNNPARPAVALRDGSPPLPVQPSPATFRFLSELHQAMSQAGTDLWSSKGVFELKGIVLDAISSELSYSKSEESLQDTSTVNGHVEAEPDAESKNSDLSNGNSVTNDTDRDLSLQKTFDVHFLERALQRSDHGNHSQGGFANLSEAMRADSALNDPFNERLSKNANTYWKRTYLLFGLLAC